MPVWVRDYAKDKKKQKEEVNRAEAEGRKPKRIPLRKEVHIRLVLPDGGKYERRIVPGMTTRDAAERWANQHVEKVLKGDEPKRRSATAKPPTLAALRERYLDEGCGGDRQKPTTIATKDALFRCHLIPVMGTKPIDEIGPADVRKLKAHMKGVSIGYLNNGLSTLNTVLDFAVEVGLLEELRFRAKLLKVPEKEMPFYDFEEYERLVHAAAKVDKRILAVVLLGGDAGLRRGEMLALSQARVRFDRGVISVVEAMSKRVRTTTKGLNVRDVPMSDRLAEVLRDLRHLRGDFVLYRDDGEPATGRVIQRWMERAERRAGMDLTGRCHVLRHTFCSHLAMEGVPVSTIKSLAGHKSIATTMRYMHLSPEARAEGIRMLQRRRASRVAGANREAASGQMKTP